MACCPGPESVSVWQVVGVDWGCSTPNAAVSELCRSEGLPTSARLLGKFLTLVVITCLVGRLE